MWLIAVLLLAQLFCTCPAKLLSPRNVGKHAKWSRYNINTLEIESYAIDIKEKIIELQCYARCENSINYQPASHAEKCQTACRQELLRSPRRGKCSNVKNENLQNIKAQHHLACLDNCSYDFDCPEVQRCCPSSCGPACMPVIGLEEDVYLPPIPKILRFKLPRGHKVEITIQSQANSSYFFHVEARSHIGLLYSPRKLSAWHWQPVEKIAEIYDSISKRTDISFNLKPGLWYQVRVAAVNAFGFRGYSEPSRAFILPSYPKAPKAPTDLKIMSSNCDAYYCSVKIIWCPSKSNLPVEKYKIIWSLYVKSKDESIISNETNVKDSTKFEITRLQPESSYYIQVQAMSINGGRRLKSTKCSVLYNTTTIQTQQIYPTHKLKCSGRFVAAHKVANKHTPKTFDILNRNTTTLSIEETTATTRETNKSRHDVSFRYNRNFGMIVQISGLHMHKEKVFELCAKETNCADREYSAVRAKFDIYNAINNKAIFKYDNALNLVEQSIWPSRHMSKDTLEFGKLNYKTTYVVKIIKTAPSSADETVLLSFTTPDCQTFRKRHPAASVVC